MGIVLLVRCLYEGMALCIRQLFRKLLNEIDIYFPIFGGRILPQECPIDGGSRFMCDCLKKSAPSRYNEIFK